MMTKEEILKLSQQEFHQRKVAFITGITGQDGSYLAEYLLELGYKVHGLIRRSSTNNLTRIQHLLDSYDDCGNFVPAKVTLHFGDVLDGGCMTSLISQLLPSEIYNLAAMSHVKVSFSMPDYTSSVNGLGCQKLLQAIELNNLVHLTRFYQASTSEMFGKVEDREPQSECTPFNPQSPYAASKLLAHHAVVGHRQATQGYACCGILFNHESPRRGCDFLTRKVTLKVAEIHCTGKGVLVVGNLDSFRDWGHARDYVRGMHAMLQQNQAKDYVLATGTTVTVAQFIEMAFQEIDVTISWKGKGECKVGVCSKTGRVLVKVDARFYRPAEVDFLLGDAKLAKQELKWDIQVSLQQLVQDMVSSDIAHLQNGYVPY